MTTAKIIGHLLDLCDLLDKFPESFNQNADGTLGIDLLGRYTFTIKRSDES